jgi:hypothetical protein
MELCARLQAENLSEKFSAEMEFCKIDPWSFHITKKWLNVLLSWPLIKYVEKLKRWTNAGTYMLQMQGDQMSL